MGVLLIVDDEAYRTRKYREHLANSDYTVAYCSTFDEAHELLFDPDTQIDLLIQDLQMGRPIPSDTLQMSNSDWETYRGLSGLWFLVRQRAILMNRRIPVMILTQKVNGDFRDIVTNEVESQRIPVDVRHKISTPANSLPALVGDFLRKVEESGWRAATV